MKNFILLMLLLGEMTGAYGQKKPNIVIIISDDHAYQTIGAYQPALKNTPNLDKLAAEGAIFSKAYVSNSICGPSRAVLLTGKYSHKNGFKDNETSTFDFSQDSFIKQLTNSGYKTSWIGKIHLGYKLEGFTDYDILVGQGHYFNPDFISPDGRHRQKGYVSDIVTDKAIDWMKEHQDQPFCVVIGHKATHRTWMPDPQDFGVNDEEEFELPKTFYDDYRTREAAKLQEMSIDKDMQMGYDLKMYPTVADMRKDGNFARMDDEQFQKYIEYYRPIYDDLQKRQLKGKELAEWKYRRYMIDYQNTARSMDRSIGRVTDYLRDSGLEDNTLVIYLSDQGFYMGEHGWFDKRWMYEESFRTPMIAKMPTLIKAHSRIDQQVMNVDIAPTLLQIAQVDVPLDMQGKSFLPLLRGDKKKIRDVLYYHYYEKGEHAVSPHFGISDGRYKLIRLYHKVEGWEFYDLKADPQEMINRYEDPKFKKQIEKMKAKLVLEIKKVDDKEALELLDK